MLFKPWRLVVNTKLFHLFSFGECKFRHFWKLGELHFTNLTKILDAPCFLGICDKLPLVDVFLYVFRLSNYCLNVFLHPAPFLTLWRWFNTQFAQIWFFTFLEHHFVELVNNKILTDTCYSMLTVVLGINTNNTWRWMLFCFYFLIVENAFRKQLEKYLSISSSSSNEVTFWNCLKFLANYFLIGNWSTFFFFFNLVRVIVWGILSDSLQTWVII